MKKTRELTEIAISIALAAVCHFICILKMPQGGSVALTMVPILFIAFRRGPAAGIISGILYGILSQIFDGVIYHPMSFVLDYLVAFGILGIAGFFPKSIRGIILGSIAGVAGRFISSVISGGVIFASYAPEGQNAWIYSLGYQATYMIPELIIAVLVLTLLYCKAQKLFVVK